MKTMTLALAAFAAVALGLSAFAADEKKAAGNADKLVGTWEATKGDLPAGSTAEFTKAGKIKVTIKGEDKTETHEGTYKLDGDTITVTATREGKERTHSMTIKKLTDKELVLADPKDTEGKKTVEFKKKK
jgi:uncharacterized protein (TIGR03066 family)